MAYRKVMNEGIELIKSFEKLKLSVYKDQGGKPTIGWGHLIKKGESFPKRITGAVAAHLFARDLQGVTRAVNDILFTHKVKASGRQFAAMVSLAYNIGIAGFKRSTVLACMKKGDPIGAGNAFIMWHRVGGKRSLGLARRRVAEMQLFFGK